MAQVRDGGEWIELSNQRDGSRGLPTTAYWPGSRARYRIITAELAVTIHRRPAGSNLPACHAPADQSRATRYLPFDRAAHREERRVKARARALTHALGGAY